MLERFLAASGVIAVATAIFVVILIICELRGRSPSREMYDVASSLLLFNTLVYAAVWLLGIW